MSIPFVAGLQVRALVSRKVLQISVHVNYDRQPFSPETIPGKIVSAVWLPFPFGLSLVVAA